MWSCYIMSVLLRDLSRACGGMVDTLVLGTSAQAWEFESLHAQFDKNRPINNQSVFFIYLSNFI